MLSKQLSMLLARRCMRCGRTWRLMVRSTLLQPTATECQVQAWSQEWTRQATWPAKCSGLCTRWYTNTAKRRSGSLVSNTRLTLKQLPLMVALFNGHALQSLPDYAAKCSMAVGPLSVAVFSVRTGHNTTGERETKLVKVWATAEVDQVVTQTQAQVAARVSEFRAAGIIYVPAQIFEYLDTSRSQALENLYQFADLLYLAATLSTGLTGHAVSNDGNNMAGPIIAVLATIPPSSMSTKVDGATDAMTAARGDSSAATVSAPAIKSLAETRTLQLQTLRAAQTQRIGTAHAVEVRKQELVAKAKQLIVELYVALHSAPRYTTLVGLSPWFGTARVSADLNFFTFAEVAFTPFISRRFNSMTSGQGAAAAKALVALAAQLPSEAIDALNGEGMTPNLGKNKSIWTAFGDERSRLKTLEESLFGRLRCRLYVLMVLPTSTSLARTNTSLQEFCGIN